MVHLQKLLNITLEILWGYAQRDRDLVDINGNVISSNAVSNTF